MQGLATCALRCRTPIIAQTGLPVYGVFPYLFGKMDPILRWPPPYQAPGLFFTFRNSYGRMEHSTDQALQACQGGNLPTLIRIQTKAGHGAGMPTSMVIQEVADRYAFLHKTLGM